VPEHTDVDLNSEFNHIKQWAAANGLIINSNKTKEVVFRQPRVSCFHLPAAIDDIDIYCNTNDLILTPITMPDPQTSDMHQIR